MYFDKLGLVSECYLIVEVVDLQLIASSAVGEVEAAVLFGGEQLCVLMLFEGTSVTQQQKM